MQGGSAGQTGSGKTYTLLGYGEVPGIVGLAVARICSFAQKSPDEVHLKISMLEIYKERIRDLLPEPNSKQSSLKVQVTAGDSLKLEILIYQGQAVDVVHVHLAGLCVVYLASTRPRSLNIGNVCTTALAKSVADAYASMKMSIVLSS